MIDKILFHGNIPKALLLFLAFHHTAAARQTDTSRYGVPVVSHKWQYESGVAKDSLHRMVELRKWVPGIVYDLRYATANNFMHRRMYPKSTNSAFLRLPVVEALQNIQYELNAKGYGLKVFDAYRPYSVTVAFWELVKDPRYVAEPTKGSGHNRGLAIDCTIITLTDRKELEMGTGFDNFTDSAHHNFTRLPQQVLSNRKMFREIMEKYGFRAFETEWWHYSWPNNREYEVLDIPFRQLK
ncbi:MAG TPA: M15 family metallopeptidase [Pseudobacter sp.]|nr:M15 family metallopeptidase [Pseudobacter sp.]